MTKHSIACAIDVNDYDQNVIDLAAQFAEQFDVELDLIHVTENLNGCSTLVIFDDTVPCRLDRLRLAEIETNILGVTVLTHHLVGNPAKNVLGFVQQNQPQLLVLGTHARRGFSRIFGSTAMKILRKANCPVAVIKQRKIVPFVSTCEAVY